MIPITQSPAIYDAENAQFVEDIPAYLLLGERFGQSVLDVGCGSGRITFPLVEHGYSVTGVDPSSRMLQLAQEHPLADSVAWVENSITSVQLTSTFDLAIFSYNGFCHLTSAELQLQALTSIAGALRPGGGVVLDLPNPLSLLTASGDGEISLERTFTDTETGHLVMQSFGC